MGNTLNIRTDTLSEFQLGSSTCITGKLLIISVTESHLLMSSFFTLNGKICRIKTSMSSIKSLNFYLQRRW